MDPRVQDRCREAVLEAQRAGNPVSALADADHADALRVDVGAAQQRFEHRGEDRFPVRTRRDPLFVEARPAGRVVECHPVIPAFARGGARVVQFDLMPF